MSLQPGTIHVDAFLKDPDAVLDYSFDWDDGYLAAGETISTSTMIATTGITIDDDTNDTTTATVWLSGGTVGEDYTVTNRITTSASRTDDRSIRIRVVEK